MHVSEFKARFSEVIELLEQGITIRVVKGKAGNLVGYFSKKEEEAPQKTPRPLGILQNEKVNITLEDMQWSEEELDEWGV